MRRVSVDPLAKTIKAQGGCLWVDVDKAAGEHELVTVGGTVNHTGIGGLTLGGGYGWLSGKYGLVIDNLLAVQMVLADGSIVTASGDENIDLFWAVRGAGQSFGVATEFTYKAHEQKTPVWAGQLAFLPTHLEELAEVANQLSKSSDGSSAMMYGFTTPPPLFKPVVLAVVFFDGPESAAKDHFAPLLALNPVRNLTSTMPYTAVNSLLNEWSVHGGRKSGKGSSFATPLRPSFFKSMFDEYTALQTRIPDARALILFEFFASEKICSVPQSATAFASRGHYQNVIVSPRWTDPKDDDACRAWAREMAAKFDDEAARAKRDGERTMDLGGVGQYGNYDGLNDKPSAIFGSNYTQLRKLKMIYDPGNMFCKAHLKI